MQYLASSPRHMPTHTNTHKKGSNPPFLSSLGSQAQLKVKHKNRFSPPSIRNSSAHPQLFYWSWMFISDADLNQVLTATVLAPRVRHCVHAMQSQPHLLLLFLHGSLWGHTRPDTISTLLRTHLPRRGNVLIAQQETRFITLVQSPFQVRCRVRRKVPPGVPWLPGEVSYQMCVWSGGAQCDGTDVPACN